MKGKWQLWIQIRHHNGTWAFFEKCFLFPQMWKEWKKCTENMLCYIKPSVLSEQYLQQTSVLFSYWTDKIKNLWEFCQKREGWQNAIIICDVCHYFSFFACYTDTTDTTCQIVQQYDVKKCNLCTQTNWWNSSTHAQKRTRARTHTHTHTHIQNHTWLLESFIYSFHHCVVVSNL